MTIPLKILLFSLTIFCIIGCCDDCHKSFITQRTETKKYPFSGIGLVRENPTDTITVFYSHATEQLGVNEVLIAEFATDTVVGMNDSWVNVDFGKEYGRESVYFQPPNYLKEGGQYFKICNNGKKDLNYFIVLNPLDFEKYNFLYPGNNETEFKKHQMYIYSISDDKNIYDILYPEGKYEKEKLSYLNDLYHKHDKNGKQLFFINKESYLKEEFSTNDYVLSRTININNSQDTLKINGQSAFYGKIHPNQCLSNNENTGGFMLTGCYDSTGENCIPQRNNN